MRTKMAGGPASVKIKIVLLAIAMIIALATYIYTQSLIQKLESRERQIAQLYASSLQQIADLNTTNTDFTFLLDVIKRIDFPLILTDSLNNVALDGMSGGVRNLDIDSTWTQNQLIAFLQEKIKEFGEINEPIEVYGENDVVLTKIYYGDSDLITALRYYPYLQILFAVMFIIIAYFSFSYLKKNEQSNIWVGMAKETAHQLGTPISSLMGWNEILKINSDNPIKVEDITDEMSNDLERLNKIANRFSKIGSKPSFKKENLTEVISKVIEYFNRRLPSSRENIRILLSGSKDIEVMLNVELFEWVIENLIKNALDAIERQKGQINFKISEDEKHVFIEVSDNGKGIDLKHRKDVFRPGYSTKRRGWGLGLSLSKRIIEDYHKGKIFVKHTVIKEGTTFQITLLKGEIA
ncbi:MAG: HAMP domain-containing histidine kinase [Chlorobi bacterium]|nr:HAMP domain-containing histidine kinase [Chlorobiota bacterium]